MIGFLQGVLKLVSTDKALCITDSGVGYLVTVNAQIAATKPTELYIYTHVKEDRLDLLGFISWEERSVFELLLDVSGVGPSTAYNIISAGHLKLIEAIQQADISFFTSIPRVGKKVAQKIIIDLGGKLGQLKTLQLTPHLGPWADLLAALEQLGYSETEVQALSDTIDLSTGKVEDHLKSALKLLQNK